MFIHRVTIIVYSLNDVFTESDSCAGAVVSKKVNNGHNGPQSSQFSSPSIWSEFSLVLIEHHDPPFGWGTHTLLRIPL